MRNRGQHGLYDGATHRSKGRTVLHQEHLDAKDTDGALSQSVDRPLRVLLRTLVDAAAHDRVQSALIVTDAAVGAGRRAQRGVDDVAHAVAMNRLDGRVRARLARRATDHHDGDLLDERRKLLGVEAVGKRAGARCRERRGGDEGLERGADGLGLARTKDVVAAAIVGEVARLEQVRVAELLSGLDDGGDERAERVVGRDGREGSAEMGRKGATGTPRAARWTFCRYLSWIVRMMLGEGNTLMPWPERPPVWANSLATSSSASTLTCSISTVTTSTWRASSRIFTASVKAPSMCCRGALLEAKAGRT